MNRYVIYKATNTVNQKSYIGFSSNFESRKAKHIWNSYNRPVLHFHRAISKYGESSFVWEILYESDNKEHTWLVMEEFFIRKYNTYAYDGYGYNYSYGGYGKGKVFNEESRRNMAKAKIGRKQSPETIAKRVLKNKGKKRTAEFCQGVSKSNLGRKHTDKSKHNMSNGQKIKIDINGTVYFGWLEAAKAFNVSVSTIRRWCNNGKLIYTIQ